MKVAVIGGTGVFGEHLVRLLVRDGHQVIVAGRGRVAVERLTRTLDLTGLVLDRTGDLSPLWALEPQVVVDAAGPFHAYGSDPYRLARAAVAQRVHYLDLADDAGFCTGIGELDAGARLAGVFALSGASSVPGLSSVVVAALAAGMTEVDTIDTAILPGNRAPRGRAVVDSILHQTGTRFDSVVDGQPVPVQSWSQPAAFDLGGGLRRRAWMIEVPDQRLFPGFFKARTVIFRAGMELGVMNHGLAALGWLHGKMGFGMPGWLVALVRGGARLLAPFGTDCGGMCVSVTGRGPQGWVRRRWMLVVRRGEGPFIPGLIVRTILRNPGLVAPGAGPALAVLPLAQAQDAMSDLAVDIRRTEEPLPPLFRRILGPGFDALPPAVRATHDHAGVRRWTGRAVVTRGTGRFAKVLAALFRFPVAGQDIPVTVLKTPAGTGEDWHRQFGTSGFRSSLRTGPAGLTERFGPLTFALDLTLRDGALHYTVRSGWCLGLPLPRALLPDTRALETGPDGRFRFDVALIAPLRGGLIVRYQGFLVPGPTADLSTDASDV